MASGKVKGITIEIGGTTTKLGKAISEAQQKTKSLKSELSGVNSLLKYDPKNVTLLKQKQELLTKSISETESKLKLMKDAENDVIKAFERGDVTEEQMRDFQREITSTEQKLKSLKEESKQFGSVFKQQCEQAAKKVEKVGSKIENAGSKIKGVSAAAGGALVGSVAAFNELDEGYDSIIAKTGATGKAYEGLKESADNVFTNLPVEMEDVGNAIGEINTRFQLTDKALEDTTSEFLQFSQINNTDVEGSIANVSKVLAQFNLDGSHAGEVLDLVNEEGQRTGVSIDALFSTIQTNGATLKQMGLNLNESVVLLSEFERNGVNTNTALTAMRKAAVNYTKEGKSLKEGLSETIAKIKSAKTDTEALSIAQETFGTKGAAEMSAAIREGRFSLDDLSKSTAEFKNSVTDTFNATQDAPDKLKIAFNDLKIVGSELGATLLDSLMPIIKDITENSKQLVNIFKNMSPETQKLIITILGIVAAASPVLIGIGKLTTGIGSIINFLPTLKNGISAVLGVGKGITAFLSANPAAIIIAAIAAIITILISLYKNCEPFREFIDKLVSSVVNFVQSIPEKIENLKTKFIEKATAIKEFFQNNWKDILLFILNPVAGAFNAMYKHNDKFREKVNTILDFFKNNWKELLLLIVNPVSGAFALLYKHNDKFRNAVDSLKNDIVTKIKGAVDKIKNFFNFDWKLPHIKLPHFSMVGEFSLKNKTVPRLGVEWYAKAMENGIIMNSPTIFGMNQNGQLLGGGEAGSETVVGTTSLMNMIKNSISTEFSKFALSKMIELKAAASQILNKTYNINNKVDVKIEHFENSANQDINELADEIEEIINDKMRKNERAYG